MGSLMGLLIDAGLTGYTLAPDAPAEPGRRWTSWSPGTADCPATGWGSGCPPRAAP